MKFRIRFADQIVGAFIILALASLAFVIVVLGGSQRWFAKDISFRTVLVSAAGLSANMPVLYKGFTIGNVKSFSLNDADEVEVVFSIYDTYQDRARTGSLVELMVSPVGLGNQFLFHPGLGREPLEDGSLVPRVDSAEGKALVARGLALPPRHDDSISVLMNRANLILEEVNTLLTTLNGALKGNQETAVGRIVQSLERTMTGVEAIPGTVDSTILGVKGDLDSVISLVENLKGQVDPILADLNGVTSRLNDPNGLVASALDGQGPVYANIKAALDALTGTIQNLEKTTSLLPGELSQVAGLLTDVRIALKGAQDVLTALANNPLLKGGIPEHVETPSGGGNVRNIQF